jgi:hypothetical protein
LGNLVPSPHDQNQLVRHGKDSFGRGIKFWSRRENSEDGELCIWASRNRNSSTRNER